MTALVTEAPRYSSAACFSFCRIIAGISGGAYSLSSAFTRTSLPAAVTVYGTIFISSLTSSNRRPMKRLIEKTVFSGFVTAWRLASCPTSRSPVLVNATTDGTVRPPSADAMTVGSPPSMTATTEFVVPRSMPMILPMGGDAPSSALGSGQGFGRTAGFDRISGVSRGRDGDEGRPDHAVPQPVAAADLLDDVAVRP